VHPRLDIESSFGTFLGGRLLDTKAWDRALEHEPVACKPIDDSLGFYRSVLQRMLDELDGEVSTPTPTS